MSLTIYRRITLCEDKCIPDERVLVGIGRIRRDDYLSTKSRSNLSESFGDKLIGNFMRIIFSIDKFM